MNITHYHGRVNNRVNMACEVFRARMERVQTHFLAHVILYYYSLSSATPFWSCRTTFFVALTEKKVVFVISWLRLLYFLAVCQHRSIKEFSLTHTQSSVLGHEDWETSGASQYSGGSVSLEDKLVLILPAESMTYWIQC